MEAKTFYSRIATALKSIPFSGWGGNSGNSGGGAAYEISDSFIRNVANVFSKYSGTQIDYAKEVGDLLNSSLVMTAVNWVARALPEAELTVVTKDKEGKDVVVPDHPALALLRRPNPYFSSSTLWKGFALSWICSGNPYFIKARNSYGQLVELWYAPSFMLEPRWPLDGSAFISHYVYTIDGREIPFDQQDIIHFRNGVNPYNMRLGMSPVDSVLREVYSDSQVINYQAILTTNGAVPPAVLSLKENSIGGGSAVQFNAKEVKENYLKATQGDERGKIFVSNMAVELTKIAFSPSEMDLAAMRRMPEKRFAAVIGLPDAVLGLGSSDETSTYNNIQQADERAYENFMIPLWKFIEDELTTQLLPEFKGSEKMRFKFDLRTVRALSVDEDALYKRLTIAYKGNWIKKSEARSLAGLKTSPEDEVYFEQEKETMATNRAKMEQETADRLMAGKPRKIDLTDPEQNPNEKKPKQLAAGSTKGNDFAIAMVEPPGIIKAAILSLGNAVAEMDHGPGGVVVEPHITIKYGLHVDDPKAVWEILKSVKPFTVRINPTKKMITRSGLLLYLPVESPELETVFTLLREGTSNSETFDEYKPHISVCWLNSEAFHANRYTGDLMDAAREFTVTQIVFSDREDKKTVIALGGGEPNPEEPQIKAAPKTNEIEQAVEHWASIAPDEAVNLINAK